MSRTSRFLCLLTLALAPLGCRAPHMRPAPPVYPVAVEDRLKLGGEAFRAGNLSAAVVHYDTALRSARTAHHDPAIRLAAHNAAAARIARAEVFGYDPDLLRVPARLAEAQLAAARLSASETDAPLLSARFALVLLGPLHPSVADEAAKLESVPADWRAAASNFAREFQSDSSSARRPEHLRLAAYFALLDNDLARARAHRAAARSLPDESAAPARRAEFAQLDGALAARAADWRVAARHYDAAAKDWSAARRTWRIAPALAAAGACYDRARLPGPAADRLFRAARAAPQPSDNTRAQLRRAAQRAAETSDTALLLAIHDVARAHGVEINAPPRILGDAPPITPNPVSPGRERSAP